jgi:hypothetical protein
MTGGHSSRRHQFKKALGLASARGTQGMESSLDPSSVGLLSAFIALGLPGETVNYA